MGVGGGVVVVVVVVGVCIYVKDTMQVNLRDDLMLENVEAIWIQIRQGDTKFLVSCIYRPPSATLEYYERIVDMFECARMTEYPVISLGDLNFNYILDETLSTNPIHYIETAYDMHQLIDQPTRVDDKTSSVLDVILTSHPALHRKSAVLKYIYWVTTISFTLIWNLKIPSHQWLITTLWNFVTWKISTWRVSPMI